MPVDGMSKDSSGLASVYPGSMEQRVQDALAIHLAVLKWRLGMSSTSDHLLLLRVLYDFLLP